jgi:hypothetical protein
MQLFPAVFCEVRAVHKFDSRLVMNETSNEGGQRKEGHAVTETDVYDRICVFP